MSNTFEMIGSLKIAKGTDKFPNYEVKNFDSGWIIKTLRLNVSAEGNTHNIEVNGGYGGNDSLIYSMVKKDNNKFESIKFKYSEREKHIKDLAEFKKSVFVNGDDRHEFATQVDLADFLHEELKKEEYKDKKFRVSGEIEFSEYENKVYTRYNANRIYVVADDTEEKCEGHIEMYIDENCIDDETIEETNKMYLKGHIGQYDSKKKGDIGLANVIEVQFDKDDSKKDRKIQKIKENCECESDEYLYKIGVKVELVNKAEQVEFDESMLSEEELENLELGFTTMEELKAEHGVGKGSFEKKMRFKGWTRGYNKGAIQSAMTLEQLLSKGETESQQFQGIDDDDDLDDIFA